MGNNKAISINRNEELFEAVMKIAAKEALMDEVDELLSFDPEQHSQVPDPSENMDARVRSIIRNESRKYNRKKYISVFGKVAAVFGIFITASTVLLMSVEASRNFIINTIIGIRSDHIAIEFGQNGTPQENEQAPEIELNSITAGGVVFGYVPHGFNLVSEQDLGTLRIFMFADEHGGQIVVQHVQSELLSAFIDNEERSFAVIVIGEFEAYLFESFEENELSVLMWQYEVDVIHVVASISIDELLLFAESVYLQ